MATDRSGNEVEALSDSIAITQDVGNISISNSTAGVPIRHRRISDSTNGKSCHQCRRKTKGLAAKCKAMKKTKPCTLLFCDNCLSNRYGKKTEEVETLEDWNCPKCSGDCNCSACMKVKGLKPTGRLSKTAKRKGYSSISGMLAKEGEQSSRETVATTFFISPNQENLEDNPFDRKEDTYIQKALDDKSVKVKKISEKRLADSEEQDHSVGVVDEPGVCGDKRESKKIKVDGSNSIEEISLPVGRELTSVAGVDLCKEAVGKALQLSEFCAVFREVLEIQEGQAEHVLEDIFHGQSGDFSTTVQFHIHLLTILKEEEGEDYPEMTSSGEDSWFNVLKESLSPSQSVLKALGLDCLDNLTDYESLDGTQKLRLLNILCDEVVTTEKVRNWMKDENRRRYESAKETKSRLAAAKIEKKRLKQKQKDEIAAAIIAKNGAALSTAEHDAIVSRLKSEIEEAQAEVLKLENILAETNQSPLAGRVVPILTWGVYSYWELNSDKTQVLCRSFRKGDDTLRLNEEWTVLNDEEKKAIEEHVCSLKTES